MDRVLEKKQQKRAKEIRLIEGQPRELISHSAFEQGDSSWRVFVANQSQTQAFGQLLLLLYSCLETIDLSVLEVQRSADWRDLMLSSNALVE